MSVSEFEYLKERKPFNCDSCIISHHTLIFSCLNNIIQVRQNIQVTLRIRSIKKLIEIFKKLSILFDNTWGKRCILDDTALYCPRKLTTIDLD